jgi:CubicO group peptidase (beta-lactamase class C family)
MRKSMRRKAVSLLVVLLLITTIPVRANQTDEYVQAEMKKQRIPGLSLAVIKEGKIIKAMGYGLANVELNLPASPESVYKIGSVSKQFIATGIMLLVQEGKLGLSDKVSQHLEGTPETWRDITLRHLLTHTSGLVREAPGFNPLKIQADADVIKTAYSMPLRFAPGEKWEYCNLGYFMLAEIIRKASGAGWSEYLNQRVFQPLGMNATRPTSVADIVPNRANGYAWKDSTLENAEIILALRPSGAFLSNVLDLAKWDAALYTDGILTRSSREQMWTPSAEIPGRSNGATRVSYGLGWQIGEVNGHRHVNHGGTLTGFRAALVRFLDDKLTVVVLTNVADASPDVIAQGVAAFYIPGLAAGKAALQWQRSPRSSCLAFSPLRDKWLSFN